MNCIVYIIRIVYIEESLFLFYWLPVFFFVIFQIMLLFKSVNSFKFELNLSFDLSKIKTQNACFKKYCRIFFIFYLSFQAEGGRGVLKNIPFF